MQINITEKEEIFDNEGPVVLIEKMRVVMAHMKRDRAIGGDGISEETIKALGEIGLNIIMEIANTIYTTELTEQL